MKITTDESKNQLVTPTKSTIPVLGTLCFGILSLKNSGTPTYFFDFHVVEQSFYDIVLGNNFLAQFQLGVSYDSRFRGSFMFKGITKMIPFIISEDEAVRNAHVIYNLELNRQKQFDSITKVKTKVYVVIPPFTTMRVKVYLGNSLSGDLYFEPDLKVSDQLGILSSIFFFPYFLQSYARPH